jgi:hypothetical protein
VLHWSFAWLTAQHEDGGDLFCEMWVDLQRIIWRYVAEGENLQTSYLVDLCVSPDDCLLSKHAVRNQ